VCELKLAEGQGHLQTCNKQRSSALEEKRKDIKRGPRSFATIQQAEVFSTGDEKRPHLGHEELPHHFTL
jgi:hypothetical protein